MAFERFTHDARAAAVGARAHAAAAGAGAVAPIHVLAALACAPGSAAGRALALDTGRVDQVMARAGVAPDELRAAL